MTTPAQICAASLAPDGASAAVPAPHQIVHLLTSRRLPLGDEKKLQEAISAEFTAAGWAHAREVRLTPLDIPDFMVGSIAIEVKIGGGKREIFRQLERYCALTEVTAIVLATNVPIGLPPEIKGKPCYLASLGKGWL